jgi:transposase-like protein
MSQREHRRFTAEQKLQILREADQPGVTASEVCRKNGLAPSVFYRWRAVAQNGSASALKRDAKRLPGKSDVEARRDAELVRLRAVIAEITAENLELKKKI